MQNRNISLVKEIMAEFADLTGLTQARKQPSRYLWTDAFAVCNFLELFRVTEDKYFLDLALRLVEQVHQVLGRHRKDDLRNGWISGFDEKEGKNHPTKGGLRIGKKLNERKPEEPFDDRLEWERDGQYFHYLTKWMHALDRVGRVTEDPVYNRYAVELAKAAHSAFTYTIPDGTKRMYWKMSIDLSYPLVPSMGHHDPLDGFVSYNQLQSAAEMPRSESSSADLKDEIKDMAEICSGKNWSTSDPLGIGGLLFDVFRTARLLVNNEFDYNGGFLEDLLEDSLAGLKSFTARNSLGMPAEYRLAFRELGLSIGLKAVGKLRDLIGENPEYFDRISRSKIKSLSGYNGLIVEIENFWKDSNNRESSTWIDHRDINMVMLATSLAPGGFLTFG